MLISPQPKDIENITIHGGIYSIPAIQNIATTSGSWFPVNLEQETKHILLQPRPLDQEEFPSWLFATSSGGNYFTIRNGGAIEASVVAVSGTTIGWVSSNYDLTYELMVGL